MKFPPKSRKQSQIPRLSSFDDPHPHSSPNVIVPKQISDTRKPLRPSNWYRIASSVNNNERQRTSANVNEEPRRRCSLSFVGVHCRSLHSYRSWARGNITRSRIVTLDGRVNINKTASATSVDRNPSPSSARRLVSSSS